MLLNCKVCLHDYTLPTLLKSVSNACVSTMPTLPTLIFEKIKFENKKLKKICRKCRQKGISTIREGVESVGVFVGVKAHFCTHLKFVSNPCVSISGTLARQIFNFLKMKNKKLQKKCGKCAKKGIKPV